MLVRAQDIAEVLGGSATLGREVRNLSDLNAVVIEGMPIAAFYRLTNLFKDGTDFRASVYSVVGDHGFAGQKRLAPAASERAERVARTFAIAEKVFGDETRAREFLTLPHKRLGEKSPLEILGTEIGGREVEDILDSIAYGLPA